MKTYTNLHTHGVYSFLDGHGKYPNYAERAKELGMLSLGITEHGNIHGWLDFYDACKAADIKPILGIEAYQARKTRWDRDEEERAGPSTSEWGQRGPYHLTVLAKNLAGYHNIIKLSSYAYTEGFYVKPRIDHEMLDEFSEGIIVLSGCLSGEVQQALLRGDFQAALHTAYTMQDIVGKENYFIEIHNHDIEDEHKVHQGLIAISQHIGAPIVPTGDCHYVNKADSYSHDVMLCVGTNALIDQENRFRFDEEEFYLKSYDEMASRFEEEWLRNTLIINDMVDLNLEFGELHFPHFPDLPKEKTSDEHLAELVWDVAPNKYPDMSVEIKERIEYELSVIKRMGFPEYFLVVADLVRWAKSQGIRVGWGRGSAAGSIISYCLGITNLDPIKFNLMFERFLVEGRKSMPDIDLDFDDRYRDQVIEYARAKYGADRVVNIATFTSVGAKTAIKDATRVLGYDYATGDRLSKMIPNPVLGVAKSINESLEISKDLAEAYNNDKDARIIIDAAKGLEGIYRQPGMHPAGIIIAKTAITDYIPVMQKGPDTPVITQWDMVRAEQCGLLKIDFLALRNLAVIDICVDNIKKCTGYDLDIDAIPDDDEKTFRQLKRGETAGVFQIEGGGITDMTRDVQPESIEDIMAIMSLYRPGPMESGADKMYINRRHGREKVIYLHQSLREVLERSYGVMLYQEDVLAVARILAGFSVAEADDLRKAIGKKQMDKIGLFRQGFVDGCQKTNDVPSGLANKIYSDIEYFGGYGFGLSHAASYAMLGYVTAYLKAHYPKEYMAALMTSVSDDKEKLTAYLNECRRLNINVSAPSILSSEAEFTFDEDDGIVFGLTAIDGIGTAIVDYIIKDRKKYNYTTFHDFLRKTNPNLLNSATIHHLVFAGAFDELSSQSVSELTRKEKLDILDAEKKELGIYVTDHPLLEIWDFIANKVQDDILTIQENTRKTSVVLGGIVTKFEKKMSRAGKPFYILQFEDLTGKIEVIVFPREAVKISPEVLSVGSMGVLTGNVSREGDEDNPRIKIFYNSFEKVNTDFLTGDPPILLKSSQKLSDKQIGKLCDIIESKKGISPVYLTYPEGVHFITVKFEHCTSKSLESTLKSIVELSSLSNQEL